MLRVYAMMVRQGLHHLIQGLCIVFLHCRVCFAVAKKSDGQAGAASSLTAIYRIHALSFNGFLVGW